MKSYKTTKSVKLIEDVFGESNQALSVVDLVQTFQEEMNKTTVYRILERFEERGILHSFTGKDGLKWYAKCGESSDTNTTTHHPHFQCEVCGKSKCLHIGLSIPELPDYKITTANVLLTGKCNDCTLWQ